MCVFYVFFLTFMVIDEAGEDSTLLDWARGVGFAGVHARAIVHQHEIIGFPLCYNTSIT